MARNDLDLIFYPLGLFLYRMGLLREILPLLLIIIYYLIIIY